MTAHPEPHRPRVLIVEDEPPIRELLRLHLGHAGYAVDEAADGRSALDKARTQRFDIIVLDLMLPCLDGMAVCRALRTAGCNQDSAILMLTARDGEADTVSGLESGADDYLTKPFSIRELLARVTAVTRRHERARGQSAPAAPAILEAGPLRIDVARRQVRLRGADVELTRQEFDLLHLLASRRGIVFSRGALLTQVWSDDRFVTERTVDAVISRLRRKVEPDPQVPSLLLTAWGVGYKFADADG